MMAVKIHHLRSEEPQVEELDAVESGGNFTTRRGRGARDRGGDNRI